MTSIFPSTGITLSDFHETGCAIFFLLVFLCFYINFCAGALKQQCLEGQAVSEDGHSWSECLFAQCVLSFLERDRRLKMDAAAKCNSLALIIVCVFSLPFRNCMGTQPSRFPFSEVVWVGVSLVFLWVVTVHAAE